MGCHSSPIEKLPEDILLGILLSLPLVDAVATRPLSRRWKNLWEESCSQNSNLCFDVNNLFSSKFPELGKESMDNFFRKKISLCRGIYCSISSENIEDFVKGADMIVQHRRGKQQDALLGVNSLEIRFPLRRKHSNHVDNWISSTVTSTTKQLILVFHIRSNLQSSNIPSDYYKLSFEMLQAQTCSSLEHLHLQFVSTIIPQNFNGLPALRTLELHNTALNQENFQNMLENCPLLEILKIYYCGLVSLRVSSPLPNLKVLVIHLCVDLTRIELWAENLTNFEYDSAKYMEHLLLRGCQNLTKVAAQRVENVDEDNFRPLSNDFPFVSTLYLQSRFYDLSVVLRGSAFAHLRFLAIFVAYSNDEREFQNMPSLLNDFAPMLEELELHLVERGSLKKFKKSKRRIDGDSYNHLKRIAFTGFTGETGQTWVAKYFLMKARRLQVMTIDAQARFYKKFDSIPSSGTREVVTCRNAYNLLCKEAPKDAKLILIDN